MTLLEKSYSMIENSPKAMEWQDYEEIVRSGWAQLMDGNESPCEKRVQKFLEVHPCMVPGPFGPIGASGHSPYPASIISQPYLADFTRKVPDFMWIARNSVAIYPILIEIEAPSKKWFTSKGVQHSDLTQALGQLDDWKAWFSRPRNQLAFADHYKLDTSFRPLVPKFILIYGRRADANASDEFAAKRHTLDNSDRTVMTFDRLAPQIGARDFMTVRKDASGYVAMHIPPTLTLGPMLADERADIRGKQAALDDSPYISEERKTFLKERFVYWDEWHRSGAKRIMSTGDWE